MIPSDYSFLVTWDFHASAINPIIFLALSPDNECFIFKEINIDPKQNTTLVFAEKIVEASENRNFKLCTIDPLAGENQASTNTSVLEDVNNYLDVFRKQGKCQKIRFFPYDTKYHASQLGYLSGRDHIKQRLKNSEIAGGPFNNEIIERGVTKRLATLWIFSSCRQTLNSLYRWRMGANGKPEQKWSHHCTALEGLFKDKRFKPKVEMFVSDMDRRKKRMQQKAALGYFKSR